jgi:hypothetical protein
VTPPVVVRARIGTVCPIVHLVTGSFSSLIARNAAILDLLSANLPLELLQGCPSSGHNPQSWAHCAPGAAQVLV